MFLKQTRIRNVDNILAEFAEGEEVLVILNDVKKYNDILKELEKVTNYLKELVESELIIA